MAFLFLTFSVILFVFLFGMVNMSAFCGFIGNLNEGKTIVLDNLEVDLAPDAIYFFKYCYKESLSGNIEEVVNFNLTNIEKVNFDHISNLLKGVSAY